MTAKYTVQELVDLQIIEKPLDGNHGSIHPTSKDYVEDGIPFIMASDLSNGLVNFSSCKFITEKQANTLRKGFSIAGDILLSHKATIGRTATVQENKYPFLVLTPQVTYYRVKDKQKLNNLYLKYYFDSQYFQSILQQWAGSGSTRAYIGITEQLKLPIILPDIDIQNEIVDIIDRLDQKIYLNTQINQTLEQIAQALFKSWFVDFDPVRAKAQALSDGLSLEQAELAAMQTISGKTPEELTALSQTQPDRYAELAETAKAFPCEMVAIDGVEVPKGWEKTTLSEICEMQNGYAFKSSEWTDSGIPVIKIGSIQSKILTVEGNGFVSEDNLSLRSNFVLNDGDIAIGLTGAYVGKVGRMPANKKAMLNQRVAKFLAKRINKSETFYSFIYMNVIQEEFKNFVDFTAQGSAQPNISTKDILKYPLLLANNDVHLAFEKLLKKILDKSIFNSYQNEILSNSRDLLLPKLLNGEI
ncbi:restriction endonuclease subunit S [Haemophilus haemolyticus]|uniref:restriction endonuclease subunit S n=1 Tax=Haemophilus haemolyticus TaxID=726 RepID=UPI000E586D74|nr:restriction endonuclease subunit S [Haemophilus haemolyticus]